MDWNRPFWNKKTWMQKCSELFVLWRFGTTGCSSWLWKDAATWPNRCSQVCRDGFQRVPEKDGSMDPDHLWWSDASKHEFFHCQMIEGGKSLGEAIFSQKIAGEFPFCQDNYTALYFIGCRGEEVIHHLPCLAQKLTMQRRQGGGWNPWCIRYLEHPWAIICRNDVVTY